MKHNQKPSWRWIRARRLADNDLTPRNSRDDKHVRRAFRFVKRLRRRDIKAEERLASDYPKIYEAFQIYDDTQSGVRWVFEASVMANEPVETMAAYLNADPKVLEVYETLFFDVRDALKSPGCMISNLLMPFTTNNCSPRDPDVFWKAIAYFGGWNAVRSSWEVGHATPEALDFFNKANRQKIVKNAFDAMHSLQIHSMNSTDVIKAAQDQRRLDHETETPQGGDQTQESMGALLVSMKLNVISARAELPQEEPRLQQPLLPDTMSQAKEVEVIKEGAGEPE